MSSRSFKGAPSGGFAVQQSGGGGGGYGGGGHGHGGGGGYGGGRHGHGGGGVQSGGSFHGGSFGGFSGGSAAAGGRSAWVQGGGYEDGAFGVHDGSFAGGAGGGFGGGAGGGFGGGIGVGHGGGFGGGHGGGAGGPGLLSGSEKDTMQNLNDRMGNYMANVQALEDANGELERKIREWYDKHKPGGSTGEGAQDYSKYYQQITECQAKIKTAEIENSTMLLIIDNSRLAADDFRLKYENELVLCQSVHADINGLRRVHDELTQCKSDLESEVESLKEELAALKKNHEEEIKGHQSVAAGELDVQMRAAPGINLLDAMNKMRVEYENLAAKNRQEAEEEFKKKSEKLKQDISTGVEQVHSSKTETSELKRTLQALQIELQSQLSMRSSLEQQLAETEGKFCQQLSVLQTQISAVEEQLTDLKSECEHQSEEHMDLLGMKERLEQEIMAYKKLLEDHDGGSGSGSGSGRGSGSSSGKDAGSSSGGYGSSRAGGSSSGGHGSSRAGGSTSGGYGSSSGAGSASHGTSSSSTTKAPVVETKTYQMIDEFVNGVKVSSKRVDLTK